MSTQHPAFDPETYKASTRQEWQQAAAAWDRWAATLQGWFAPVTEAMVDLAQLGPGERVLDVAAGTGEPTLSAAERVGPTGYVLATDIAANMLAVADRAARERGLSNVETRVMDGEHLDLPDASFDAALSRFGLIFFPNRQRGLAEIRRVLRPGGRAVVASFTTPANNPYFSIPLTIARRRANLAPPPAGGPGPFSFGDPATLTAELDRAGFQGITTWIVIAPLRMSSTREFVGFQRETFAAVRQLLTDLPEAEQEHTWDEIIGEMRQFEGSEGFVVQAEVLVGAGVKP